MRLQDIINRRKDFKVQPFKASGPGGQHRNKVSTAIRITHTPTGIAVEASEHRKQPRNKAAAWDRMRTALQLHYFPEQDTPRYQAGFDVVRTYNQCTDRVKDHITGATYSFKRTVGSGKLETVIEDRRNHMLGLEQ